MARFDERELRTVRVACYRRAWDDATDDDSRTVLWDASDALRQLMRENHELKKRLARQALHLERAELDAEVYRRAAFGEQKGGAA